jgi:hypothetical protein
MLHKLIAFAKLLLAGESDYYPGGVRQGAASVAEAPRLSFNLPDSQTVASPLGGREGG